MHAHTEKGQTEKKLHPHRGKPGKRLCAPKTCAPLEIPTSPGLSPQFAGSV